LRKLLKVHGQRVRQDYDIIKNNVEKRKPRVPLYDNSDKAQTRRVKNLATEETYETWHQEKNINKNVYKFMDHDIDIRNAGEEDDEIGEDHSDTEALKPEEQTAAGIRFLIESSGLEVLPYTKTEQPIDLHKLLLSKKVSYFKRHTGIVLKLLHLSVMRRKWYLAYKCFTLLIRIPQVDIRSIWPIGLEIITRLAELKYQEQQPDDTISEYNLRVYDIKERSHPFKDEQFLQWLEIFYPINKTLNPRVPYRVLPFRVGTVDSAPFYVLALVWTLLMKYKFPAANEKLSELLLTQPYISDGLYHFLQGFSYQLEASMLISQEDRLDKQRIERLMHDAIKCFDEAKKLGAEFPERIIQNEFSLIKIKLAEDIENDLIMKDLKDNDPFERKRTEYSDDNEVYND
jgi:RNA polymerase I-specific transcription initiation factor RRN11